MHLGLDDVDAALAAVADARSAFSAACGCFAVALLQVVQGDGGGDHRVHDAFGNFALRALGVSPQNGRVGHQVAHIAQEHQ